MQWAIYGQVHPLEKRLKGVCAKKSNQQNALLQLEVSEQIFFLDMQATSNSDERASTKLHPSLEWLVEYLRERNLA